MGQEEVLRVLKRILQELSGQSPDLIQEHTALASFGFDHTALSEATAKINDQLAVSIKPEQLSADSATLLSLTRHIVATNPIPENQKDRPAVERQSDSPLIDTTSGELPAKKINFSLHGSDEDISAYEAIDVSIASQIEVIQQQMTLLQQQLDSLKKQLALRSKVGSPYPVIEPIEKDALDKEKETPLIVSNDQKKQPAGFVTNTVAETDDHIVIPIPPSRQTLPVSVTPPVLPDAERKALLEDWNGVKVNRPEKVIHQYLEEYAVSLPDTTAVSDSERSLSYHQLNQRANQVAHYFIAQGIRTGHFIGVCFERNVDMIVALLACIKVGAIYVPLDPVNPTKRLRIIIEDAQADFLITTESLLSGLPSEFANVICMDRDEAKIRACSTSNLFKKINPNHLVYVNYTSGSTGKPKGVLIPHYAVVDHHLAMINALGLDAGDKIYSVASMAFDPSVQDFFLPLMIGAQVYIAGNDEKSDFVKLKNSIDEVRPTIMQATPTTWRMLISAGWEGSDRLTVLSGGEGLTRELSNKLKSRSKRLFNLYGPTETTIWSTVKELKNESQAALHSTSYEPIGRPLENVQIYLLDSTKNLVPVGVEGEIYIGGVGVAPQGYFKRPELNAEKFIDNPFDPDSPGKLYRTGDIGRFLPNGDLEYLHRADTQVKIKGNRIELGEIESAIAGFEGIQENIVSIVENQNTLHLVAYCIAKEGYKIDYSALKRYLSEKLPLFMVPNEYMTMQEFPLTATMKVNRQLLPKPFIKE